MSFRPGGRKGIEHIVLLSLSAVDELAHVSNGFMPGILPAPTHYVFVVCIYACIALHYVLYIVLCSACVPQVVSTILTCLWLGLTG